MSQIKLLERSQIKLLERACNGVEMVLETSTSKYLEEEGTEKLLYKHPVTN